MDAVPIVDLTGVLRGDARAWDATAAAIDHACCHVGFFVVVIGLVDNILRPLLVGKDTKMPDYLILIATLGGMEIYGINGFVIGPLIAALFIACWNLLSGREHAGNTDEIDEEFIEEGKVSRDE